MRQLRRILLGGGEYAADYYCCMMVDLTSLMFRLPTV